MDLMELRLKAEATGLYKGVSPTRYLHENVESLVPREEYWGISVGVCRKDFQHTVFAVVLRSEMPNASRQDLEDEAERRAFARAFPSIFANTPVREAPVAAKSTPKPTPPVKREPPKANITPVPAAPPAPREPQPAPVKEITPVVEEEKVESVVVVTEPVVDTVVTHSGQTEEDLVASLEEELSSKLPNCDGCGNEMDNEDQVDLSRIRFRSEEKKLWCRKCYPNALKQLAIRKER